MTNSDTRPRLNALVDAKTCANTLGIPYTYLKAETKLGNIPCVRLGKKIRYSVDAVERAIIEKASFTPDPTYTGSFTNVVIED